MPTQAADFAAPAACGDRIHLYRQLAGALERDGLTRCGIPHQHPTEVERARAQRKGRLDGRGDLHVGDDRQVIGRCGADVCSQR
ncbi:MAG: hypothetical protein ACO200_10215, partial [Steroidobacteraceae bacterium]